MCLKSALESVFLKLQTFSINRSDGVCFSIKPRRSLFLVKPQGFSINGNEIVCDGAPGLIEGTSIT